MEAAGKDSGMQDEERLIDSRTGLCFHEYFMREHPMARSARVPVFYFNIQGRP